MRPWSSLSWLLLPVTLAACSSAPVPSLTFSVANPFPGPDIQCLKDLTALPPLASNVRVTARQHSDDPTKPGALLCDAILPRTGSSPLAVNYAPGTKLDLFAEAFDIKGNKVATGQILGVDARLPSLPPIRMFLPETFHCNPNNAMTQSRAFHSAAVMPNGQVMVVGGLIPVLPTGTGGGSDGPAMAGGLDFQGQLYLTGTIEVYDPIADTFVPVADAGPLTPRAFHKAIALPSDGSGKFQVALYGGISGMIGSQMPAVWDYSDVGKRGFRFSVTDPTVSAAPAEIVTWDPATHTLSRAPMKLSFPSSAFQAVAELPKPPKSTGGGVVAVGGLAYNAAMEASSPTVAWSSDAMNYGFNTPGGQMGTLPVGDVRVGGSMVALSALQALLVGGVTDAAAMSPANAVAEMINVGTPPTVTPLMVSGSLVPPLQFATLTLLPSATGMPKVLLSGGLKTGSMMSGSNVALDPPGGPSDTLSGGLYLLATLPGTLSSASLDNNPDFPFDTTGTCADVKRYKAVAWNAATLMGANQDRILLTGGTPRKTAMMGCDCPMNDNSLQCALNQTAIYNVPLGNSSGKIVHARVDMGLARFGHTQSLLTDGRVIVIGGLTRKSVNMVMKTFGTREIEIYSPVRVTPPTTSVTALPPASGQVTLDPDDLLFNDLRAAGLSREPVVPGTTGGQMYTPGDPLKTALHSCGGFI